MLHYPRLGITPTSTIFWGIYSATTTVSVVRCWRDGLPDLLSLLLPLLFLPSPSLVNSPCRTCSLLAKAGSLCIWLQTWITDMFLCVCLRVCACVAEMCPSQWPSITAHLQNYILGLLSRLLVRQFSLFVKQGFCGRVQESQVFCGYG